MAKATQQDKCPYSQDACQYPTQPPTWKAVAMRVGAAVFTAVVLVLVGWGFAAERRLTLVERDVVSKRTYDAPWRARIENVVLETQRRAQEIAERLARIEGRLNGNSLSPQDD